MNVIVANEQHSNLMSNLDIDIIKSLSGEYDSSEIVDMFRSFFYSRMILDVTALKKNDDLESYSTLSKGLDPNKIIFLLPQGSQLCTPSFLTKLIDIGIYNFTTNIAGVKFLFNKPNTLKDVEHIKNLAKKKEQELAKKIEEAKLAAAEAVERATNGDNLVSSKSDGNSNKFINKGDSSVTQTTTVSKSTIIGVKNVTEHAGATTLIYMLKRELASVFGSENIVAIEIDNKDFPMFNEKNMFSVSSSQIRSALKEYSSATIILVDLNDVDDDSFCDDILYLIEPSIIMLNKLIRKDRNIFSELKEKKVILNQSLLFNSDVSDFENEAGVKIFYNMPALDERKRNGIISDFLSKLGLFNNSVRDTGANKIFGLFRR